MLALLILGHLVVVRGALLTGLQYFASIVFIVIWNGWIIARFDQLQTPDQLMKVQFLLEFVAGLLVIIGSR